MREIFVITGAPCAGKSSVIEELGRRGFSCLPEASRILIKELSEAKSTALPWIDLLAFNRMLIERQVKQYMSAPDGFCFFDRSFVDNIGYLRHSSLPVPSTFFEVVDRHRFSKTVFFMEPWKEIYATDPERKEPFEAASRLSDFMKQAYVEAGYEIVPVPKASIPKRADFILKKLDLLEETND
jgi:predicted ATPase